MIDQELAKKIKAGIKVQVFDQTGRFEGVVLARKHGNEAGASFTVRGMVADVGVEKVYPIHSPAITKLKIVSEPKRTRRAKLYFLRGLSKKKTRKKIGVAI